MNRHLLSATAIIATATATVLGAAPAGAADAAKTAAADAAMDASTRDFYITLIRQARTDGRPRAAIAYLDDFDRRHPGDREAQLLRVNCLLDLDQVTAARTAMARIPASDRSGPTLAMRGHVLAAEGKWAEAATQYSGALQASPADAFVANALGYAWLRSGQTQQGVETLRAARDLAPADTVVRNNLMLALTMTGRLGEADSLLSGIGDAREKARLRQQVAGEAARLAAAQGGLGSGMSPRGS